MASDDRKISMVSKEFPTCKPDPIFTFPLFIANSELETVPLEIVKELMHFLYLKMYNITIYCFKRLEVGRQADVATEFTSFTEIIL